MFPIVVASFVIACCVITSVIVTYVLRAETAKRRAADELVVADVKPDWLYGQRMDVPGKYPAVQTRNTKVLR